MYNFVKNTLSIALGMGLGGVLFSEYFFRKLDPRLAKSKTDVNDILNNQREMLFHKVESYPNNILQIAKDKVDVRVYDVGNRIGQRIADKIYRNI